MQLLPVSHVLKVRSKVQVIGGVSQNKYFMYVDVNKHFVQLDIQISLPGLQRTL